MMSPCRKLVFAGAFTSLLLFSAMFGRLTISVAANPIPVPTLIMPEEHINATIFSVDENLLAEVDGAYPFLNVEHEAVVMDYPLPPNSTNVSVEMNDTWLDWTYNNKAYPTAIGDWPMINWTIAPIPDYFTVNTHYEHSIPVIQGRCTLLYAMGTGRYLETYAKNTTAYVNVRMETNFTHLQVYTIEFENGTWIWHPVNYTITLADATEIVTVTVVSEPFAPLQEDFLLTFTPNAILGDINHDGTVNIQDILIVAVAFGSYPEHPKWNPIADLHQNGIINILDILTVALQFGETM